jgi:hypothetical protein
MMDSKGIMMESRVVTSGLAPLDQVLQGLRLGDNVVWQADRLSDYIHFAEPFARQAIRDGRRGRDPYEPSGRMYQVRKNDD